MTARRSAFVLVAALAAVFVIASLGPWRHLVDGAYFARFVAFALALAAFVWLGALGLARVFHTGHAGLCLLVGLVVFGAAWALNRRGPFHVILVHVDTLRAHNVGAYGYERDTTPHLDAFARDRAVLFERFIAQSASTDKSTPAMLAGIYPSMFFDPRTDEHNYVVPNRFPFLGQVLRRHGYRTVGVTTNPVISDELNYARGFQRWEERFEPRPRPHALADILAQHVLAGDERPLFLFGLFLDPHSPYTPTPHFDIFSAEGSPSPDEIRRSVRERLGNAFGLLPHVIDDYDGEIREVDDGLGSLFAQLDEVLDRTMFIITSDHGEKFLEHGEFGHGGTLYEEVLHVPMLWNFPSPLRFPALEPRTQRFASLASHVDIAPTVAAFLGIDGVPKTFRGRNLVPELYRGAASSDPFVLSESLGDRAAQRSLRSRTHKVLVTKNPDGTRDEATYRIDPGKGDVAITGPPPGELADWPAEIDRRVELLRTFYGPKPAENRSPRSLERLRALGYMR